jgi:RNA polymerase sigma factor (sigma-70 family)
MTRRKREVALEFFPKNARPLDPSLHDGPFAALMECPPNTEPGRIQDELKEVLGAAIDALPRVQRRICEGLWIEKLSMRQLAKELGISHPFTVQRERDKAIVKLQQKLMKRKVVQERLR